MSEWTTAPPTESGYYWACTNLGSVENIMFIVEIIVQDGLPWVVGSESRNVSRENIEHVHHWQLIPKPEPPK